MPRGWPRDAGEMEGGWRGDGGGMPALALARDGALEGDGPRWGDGRAGGGARNFLAKVFRVWRESVTFAG